MTVKTVTLTPIADTYVSDVSNNETKNFGTSTAIELGMFGTWTYETTEMLFQFDLSQLPVGAKLIKASFEIYAYGSYGSGLTGVFLHAVTKAWGETTATWNNKPSYNSSITYPISAGYASSSTWWKWDVVDLIRLWISGQANYGLVIRKLSSGYDRVGYRFYSREYSDVNFRPKLVLEFEMPNYLIEDEGELKKPVLVTEDTKQVVQWATVGTSPVTQELFLQEAWTDLSLITPTTLQGLISDTPKLLCLPADVTYDKLNVTAVPFNQLLMPNNDLVFDNTGTISFYTLAATLQGTGKLRVIISLTSGATWHTYVNGKWLSISPTVDAVLTNGIEPSQLAYISSSDYEKLQPNPEKIRFAYALSLDTTQDKALADSLVFTKKKGEWLHYADADVSYGNDDMLVSLYKNGIFKINYEEVR